MRTLIAAMLALVLPCTAQAYDLEHDGSGDAIRWPGTFTLAVSNQSRDVAGDELLAVVQRAAAHWSAVAGVTIQIVSEDHPGAPGYAPAEEEKNRSEVIFVDDDWEYDDSVVATTLVTSDSATHQILDADILVNEAQHHFGILPDDSQPGQGLRDDLEGALTHELGHALGLAHNNELAEATMYPSTLPGEVSKRALSPDDTAGVQALYGTSEAPRPFAESNAGCNAGVGADGMLALLALAGLLFRKRAKTLATVAVAAAVLGAAAPSAQAEPAVKVAAEVAGKVTHAQSYWHNGRIYTDVTVRVAQCEGTCGETVEYRVPGGTVGRICQQLGDLRVPAAGEEVSVSLVRTREGALRPLSEAARARLRSHARPAPRTSAR